MRFCYLLFFTKLWHNSRCWPKFKYAIAYVNDSNELNLFFINFTVNYYIGLKRKKHDFEPPLKFGNIHI